MKMLNLKLANLGKVFCAALLSLSIVSYAKDFGTIYDLESKWRDVNNNEVKVSLAAGQMVLIAMVYTGCAHACPMTISKMQQIEQELVKVGIKDVKFVLASFDVKGDRPQKLKQYQAGRKLDPAKWIFLSPESDADARELAVALGISYKELGNGDFSHSNVISLLDPQGGLIVAIDNLNAPADSISTAALIYKKNLKK